jgi:gamma-glutamyl hercynylcysteine S-oxide synthase
LRLHGLPAKFDSFAMPVSPAAISPRTADAAELRALWQPLRARLLQVWDAYCAALPPGLVVPQRADLNLPRWELGHIGWFEDWWIGRNPLRHLGTAADPDVMRGRAHPPQADALYNSSKVAHARRWRLSLPEAGRTRDDACAIHQRTLALLAELDPPVATQAPREDPAASRRADDALYFFRLCLHHEAMHLEAWLYMAQALGLNIPPAAGEADVREGAPTGAGVGGEGDGTGTAHALHLPAQTWTQGHRGTGFAFDNECGERTSELAAFEIDRQAVSWERFLPFVEDGGYRERGLWTAEGWAWRQAQALEQPAALRGGPGSWEIRQGADWLALDPTCAAVHLSQHEAQAWCRWAGRRLPSEAEWECAAHGHGAAFSWGQVWEWTSSAFVGFAGFVAHPYRDYSQPWFDGRPVLRGASSATWPAVRDLRFRNYFPAGRNDILAGFRSCAVSEAGPGSAPEAHNKAPARL